MAGRIEDLLRLVDANEAPQHTKVASEHSAPAPDALKASLRSAIAEIGQTKVANTAAAPVAAPVNDLMKMAAEIVQIDRDGEIKHAQLVGAAMGDAFVSRVNQWERAAAGVEKNAQAQENAELSKFAAEQPELFNVAVQQGYSDASNLMDKVGQELYQRHYNATLQDIQKTAEAHFAAGYIALHEALQGA